VKKEWHRLYGARVTEHAEGWRKEKRRVSGETEDARRSGNSLLGLKKVSDWPIFPL
jgi:hypothetical protein